MGVRRVGAIQLGKTGKYSSWCQSQLRLSRDRRSAAETEGREGQGGSRDIISINVICVSAGVGMRADVQPYLTVYRGVERIPRPTTYLHGSPAKPWMKIRKVHSILPNLPITQSVCRK